MSMHLLNRSVYFLLVSLFSFNSSCGQAKLEIPMNKESDDKKSVGLLSKILKPKGLFKEASIGSGIQDKKGNIWLGSNGEGIFCFNGKYFIQYTMKEGLNSNTIYSIVEDKVGNIWVGTNKGLHRFNGETFENVFIVLKNFPSSIANHSNFSITPNENSVWSMITDKKGIMWLGTGDGVYCYDGKEFTRFIDNPSIINKDSLQLKAIFSILETRDGNIWFTACQSEGISRFDGKTLSNIIPYKDVRRTDRVIEDKNGNLWFACVFKGVGRYDGKVYTQNVFNEKPINGPSNIVEDRKGNLWFDTQDGLGKYDGKKLIILSEKDGIPNKNLVPIMLDNSGSIWFSNKGMGLYQFNDGKFICYSE